VLAAVRGLHADGFLVGATAEHRGAPGLWSRGCAEGFTGAPPLEEPQALVGFLERIVAAGRYRVLLAGTDEALFAISRYRAELDGSVELGLPDHEVVSGAFDRTVLARAAARAGLNSPQSILCSTDAEAMSAATTLGFPVLLKPVMAILETEGRVERWPSRRAGDERSLTDELERFRPPLIVQRCEPGRVASFAGVVAEGRLLAVVFSRYLRTWPPEAGNAAFSRTEEPPPGLVQAMESMLGEIGWEGLFELELIERRDGTLLPIDFNPRVHGSLALALGAGVNLPAIWARRLLGERVAPVHASAGVHYRWEDVDLRHRLRQLRAGRIGEARAALRPRRPTVGAYLRLSDPAPFAARTVELAAAARRRVTTR